MTSAGYGQQFPDIGPDVPLARWPDVDLADLKEELRRCVTGEEVRGLATILITPLVRGGDGSIAIENQLPRFQNQADDLFLLELFSTWLRKEPTATARMLYEAMKQIGEDRAEALRPVLGVEKDM